MNINNVLVIIFLTIWFFIITPSLGNLKNKEEALSLKVISAVNVNDLLRLTNIERSKLGLDKLTLDPTLMKSAFDKAKDMENRQYWSHFAPDGTTPWFFISKNGYKYEYAGENLAKNYESSERVIKGWMRSPSHRENLMKSEFKNVGFAIIKGNLGGKNDNNETILVVAHYGKKLESQELLYKAVASHTR